jgi:hypothetical protein
MHANFSLSPKESSFLTFLLIVGVVAAFIPAVALWKYLWRCMLAKDSRISFLDECKYLVYRVFGRT